MCFSFSIRKLKNQLTLSLPFLVDTILYLKKSLFYTFQLIFYVYLQHKHIVQIVLTQ